MPEMENSCSSYSCTIGEAFLLPIHENLACESGILRQSACNHHKQVLVCDAKLPARLEVLLGSAARSRPLALHEQHHSAARLASSSSFFLPARESRRVDLPEPEGPMIASMPPGSAYPDNPWSTV